MYENVELCFACRHFDGKVKYKEVLPGGATVAWASSLLEDVKGLCHAQPPVLQGDQLFRFPQVKASDWCGRWEPRRSPIDEDLEALYESDRPKPAPHSVQEDPIDPESWWAAYECCGCFEVDGSTCFDVRFDGRRPHEQVQCPMCGCACGLKDYWNATSSGYGSRSEKDAKCSLMR